MASQEEITLVIYGLQVDNDLVRADVFARKFSLLERALRQADKIANGKKHYNFLVRHLDRGSAIATIQERASSARPPKNSSVRTVGKMCEAIYEGRTLGSETYALLKTVSHLADGSTKYFSHAEVKYAGENVIRLDRFFEGQSSIARREISEEKDKEPLFAGVCLMSFDGALELLDGRGMLLQAKLTLSAGGSEVDCVIRNELYSSATNLFKTKVRVTGIGIYSGESYLPKRFNIESIKPLDTSRSLLGWRGKLGLIANEEIEWVDDET